MVGLCTGLYKGLIPNHHIKHFALLLQIIHCLNNKSVTLEELNEAEKLVEEYRSKFDLYLGEEATNVKHFLAKLFCSNCEKLGSNLGRFCIRIRILEQAYSRRCN